MEQAQRLVRTYMATGRDEEASELASGIDEGTFSLLSVVQGLGEYLTADESATRAKGVGLLTDVLGKCRPEKISAKSTLVMTTFLRGKLEDVDTVQPALRGLRVLANLETFSDQCAVEMMDSIFEHIRMKSFVQNVRFVVFKIVDRLMSRHRTALKSMGPRFVTGYIGLAEGEKDPRNLVVSFAIVRVLLIEFDVSAQVDNLFDITFCYFPITFNPPPGDPYGISTEDLKGALRQCLSATPAFGPLALPLFLEKLSASAGNPKRDTLHTLDICLPVYGRAVASQYSKKLWDAFRIEIFQPVDVETEALALKAAQSLIRTLYPPTTNTEPVEMDGLVVDIVQECKKILREPEKSQAQHAIKVLGAFVGTTSEIRRYILAEGINHLLGMYRNPDEVAYRSPILAGIVGILMAISQSTADSTIPADERPLEPYKDVLLGAVTSGIKISNCRRPALEGSYHLIKIPGVLNAEELGYLTHNVDELISESSPDLDELRPSLLKVLTAISDVSPKPIVDTTLPLLFQSLPDYGPERTAFAEQAKYRHILASLTTLCVQPTLFETLVIRLSAKLDLLCSPTRQQAENVDIECDAAYAHAILSALSDVLQKKVEKGHLDIPKYSDRLGSALFWIFIRGATPSNDAKTPSVTSNPRVVSAASKIIEILVRSLPSDRQSEFVTSLFSAFQEGKVTPLLLTRKLPAESIPFAPFRVDSPASQKAVVPLFSAVIVPLRKDVPIPVDDTSSTLTALVNWAIEGAETDAQATAVYPTIGSIINKRLADVTSFLENTVPDLWAAHVVPQEVPLPRRRRFLQAYIWITKALLVRNHPDVKQYVDRLFVAFADPRIGWDAARALGQLGTGGEQVLTKLNYAVTGLLHVQKFFTATLPRILAGCKVSASPEEQTTYLVALTSLIKSVPKSMYAHELPTMMPLLLRGIDLPEEDMRANVINTLISVAEEESAGAADIISEHSTTIIASLLKNSDFRTTSSPRLREASLRCLGLLPNTVKYSVLHPQKSAVISKLSKALDDPKRAVRKEAVDARHNWFALSG